MIKTLYSYIKKITLFHSIIYVFKNKYLNDTNIEFKKTFFWLNDVKEDAILMISLPRTGQNFFLDVISDYCQNFLHKNVNYEKEIVKQQYFVHDNSNFYNFKSNLHLSVNAGFKGFKRFDLKKIFNLPLTYFVHTNTNKNSIPGIDKRYKNSKKIILLRNITSSLFSWFKMMSRRYPDKYKNFRKFLELYHLDFAIKFYNSWRYEILKDEKSIIIFYEDISNKNKKFDEFKNIIFKLFNNVNEKKLRLSIKKFSLNKVQLELNKNEYSSNFSYKGSNDYLDEINKSDEDYIKSQFRENLDINLFNYLIDKSLL